MKSKSQKPQSRRKAVITKRMVISRSRQAFAAAAEDTMKVVGYNVVAEDNSVVKLMRNGSKEIIGRIQPRKKLTSTEIRKALAR